MEVDIDAPATLATFAADAVERRLADRPDAVLGLATGSSPPAVYDELARRHAAGLSFARARAFLLDEYVGLPPDHPERYRTVIEREFALRVDTPASAVLGPEGNAADLPAACRDCEAAVAASGGVDLQVLGVGTDGHLALNEPGLSPASRTRLKTLTEQTRVDNARFFGGAVSAVLRHVLTQGLGTIAGARHLVLRPRVAAGRRRCTRWSRAPSARCGRRRRSSSTSTCRSCSTTPRRAASSSRTTTGRRRATSRRGRASESHPLHRVGPLVLGRARWNHGEVGRPVRPTDRRGATRHRGRPWPPATAR